MKAYDIEEIYAGGFAVTYNDKRISPIFSTSEQAQQQLDRVNPFCVEVDVCGWRGACPRERACND